jgi:hypothetical protein
MNRNELPQMTEVAANNSSALRLTVLARQPMPTARWRPAAHRRTPTKSHGRLAPHPLAKQACPVASRPCSYPIQLLIPPAAAEGPPYLAEPEEPNPRPCRQSDVSTRSRGADLARQLSVSSREIPLAAPAHRHDDLLPLSVRPKTVRRQRDPRRSRGVRPGRRA